MLQIDPHIQLELSGGCAEHPSTGPDYRVSPHAYIEWAVRQAEKVFERLSPPTKKEDWREWNQLTNVTELKNVYKLLRHGLSFANVDKRLWNLPQNCNGLVEAGFEQAKQSADGYTPECEHVFVISSDVPRAVQTGQVIVDVKGLPPLTATYLLRARTLNEMEGCPDSELKPMLARNHNDPFDNTGGAESAAQMMWRITTLIVELERITKDLPFPIEFVITLHNDPGEAIRQAALKDWPGDKSGLPNGVIIDMTFKP